MKILYLTPGCFDKGGISRYSRFQISAWREILGDDDVRVLSLLGPDINAFEERFSVTYAAGGVGASAKAAFVSRAVWETVKWRPDIIHSAHLNFSSLIKTIAKLARAQTLVNVYGVEVWSGLRPGLRRGLMKADHVISDCHFTAQYLESEGLRQKDTVTVIWDCVDLERFSPGKPRQSVLERYGIPDPISGVNLLTFGRMTTDAAYKGYERLFDVFVRTSSKAPHLRLIYGGRGELAELLKEHARNAGLSDRVFFTGMVKDEDLPDVYRSAHIFSLVTDQGKNRGEGIPLTPLEASACGVPILVGNQDGSREAVIEGINGHILDPFELDIHGEKIMALINDPENRARMGLGARERAEHEFAYPKFREKHRALLQAWFPTAKMNKETQ